MVKNYVNKSLTNKIEVAQTILPSVAPSAVEWFSKSTAEIFQVPPPRGESCPKSTNKKLHELPP